MDIEQEHKMCFLILIGLPGCGKTTFCSYLANCLEDSKHVVDPPFHFLVHVCYDKIINTSDNVPWNEARRKIASTIDEMTGKLKNTKDPQLVVNEYNMNIIVNKAAVSTRSLILIVIDDNMYYRNKPYNHNSLDPLYAIIMAAFSHPVKPVSENLHKEQSQFICSSNIIHQADLALRKIIGNILRENTAYDHKQMQQLSTDLKIKKQDLLQKLKLGELQLPKEIIEGTELSDNIPNELSGCSKDSWQLNETEKERDQRSMLLTLYYLAATWIQSWRLNSMRTKILNVLSHNGTLVLYKELDSTPTDSEGTFSVQLTGVSSSSCLNSSEARVGDLLWYVGSKRGCSVFPQQKVNANYWISFHNEKSLFPLEISGISPAVLVDDLKLYLLIEANYLKADGVRSSSYCQLEQYGIPRAWKAGDQFAIILESDVDHLAKLGSTFMSNLLSIDDGMEIVRVQRAEPVASQCMGQQMSPVQWQTHIELLQSFSAAAVEASNSESQVGVSAYPSALVTAGNRALTLDYPTVVTLPETADCFPVVNLSRMAREEVQSRSSLNLATQAGGSSSGTASDVAPIPSPARSHQPGLPEAQRSSESFTSCVQEIEIPSPDQEAGPSPERKEGSPGTSQEEAPPLSSPRESKSSDSFCSLGSASTVSIGDKTKASEAPPANGQSRPAAPLSLSFAHSQPLRIGSGPKVKPPNVLVFSESNVTVEDVKTVLHSTLHRHKYTIYPVNREQLLSAPWMDNTLLVVVCGNVPETLAPLFLTYVLAGGRMLCLCSDLLHLVLPTFRTAEVRERELVRFSYSRWRGVHLMHHVFCYQASPARTRFSRQDATTVSEEAPPTSDGARLSPPKTPASVEVVDAENKPHTLQVQVLGTEETWHSPSLLLASAGNSGGRIVFSQVHLEVDPSEYSADASLAGTLRGSEQARHEILQDLLSQHLGLECAPTQPEPTNSPAYFLGRHELKLELLSRLGSHFVPGSDNTLRLPRLTLQFCGKGVEPGRATASHLPVLVHSCPANFSTVEYFENLHSEVLGRLMIYCEVMGSSMDVVTGITLHHGLAVVPCQQTRGILNLRLKWPNDIYHGNSVKLGGLIVNCTIDKSTVVCNIDSMVN
ncbi:Biotin--protein ligase [Gryllus bimaculatus]|nr:Biotin--protein ligase [Gryllus bimaculatus]